MKKSVIVLLIVALSAILLAGCGSSAQTAGQNNAASSETGSSTTSSTSSSSATASTVSLVNPKPNIPRKLEFTKGSLPPAFEKAVDEGFVVVVGFYNPDEYLSQKVSDMAEEIVAPHIYSGQIRYLSYEIRSKSSAKVAKLTAVLEGKHLPNLTIIDGDKNIVFEDSGYMELSYFEHALYNTVYKDKSPEISDQ